MDSCVNGKPAILIRKNILFLVARQHLWHINIFRLLVYLMKYHRR